jgi:DNA-binding protein
MKNSLEILLEIQNHVFSLVKEVDLLKSDKRKLIDEINILKNKLDSQSIENKKFKKKAIFHIETIINEVDKCINKLEISE